MPAYFHATINSDLLKIKNTAQMLNWIRHSDKKLLYEVLYLIFFHKLFSTFLLFIFYSTIDCEVSAKSAI